MTFRRINSNNQDLRLIQDNIQSALSSIEVVPFVDGNMLTDIPLLTGQDNLVSHKLGRKIRFFVVSNLNADATVWQTGMDDRFINLQCSADCTVSLWVS